MNCLLPVIVSVLVSISYSSQKTIENIDSCGRADSSVIDSVEKLSMINVSNIGGKIKIDSSDSALDKNLPWISALFVGLCSVLVSGIIGVRQIRALKMQIEKSVSVAQSQLEQANQTTIKTLRANVVSANRQNWINELRDLYARFIVASARFTIKTNMIHSGIKPRQIPESDLMDVFNELRYCSSKIDLLLNPNEELSISIVAKIHEVIDICFNGESERLVEKLDEISKSMKEVFRAEWVKIKALE